MLINNKKFAKRALWIAVAWIIIGPPILVSFSIMNFTGTGQIGDTIGGITAPIIGLLSAYLVYLSFSAQTEANILAMEEANFRYILDDFEKIKVKFSEYDEKVGNYTKTTSAMYSYFTLGIGTWGYSDVLKELYYLFQSYSIFLKEAKTLSLSSDQSKTVESKLWMYHDEKVKDACFYISKWNVEIQPGNTTIDYQKALEVQALVKLDINSNIQDFRKSLK